MQSYDPMADLKALRAARAKQKAKSMKLHHPAVENPSIPIIACAVATNLLDQNWQIKNQRNSNSYDFEPRTANSTLRADLAAMQQARENQPTRPESSFILAQPLTLKAMTPLTSPRRSGRGHQRKRKEDGHERAIRERITVIRTLASMADIAPSKTLIKHPDQIDHTLITFAKSANQNSASRIMEILNAACSSNVPRTRGQKETAVFGISGYQTFCELNDMEPWPSTVSTILQWQFWLMNETQGDHKPIGYQSAQKYRGFLKQYHISNKMTWIVDDHTGFGSAIKGLKIKKGIPEPKLKTAITHAILHTFCNHYGPNPNVDDLLGLALTALYLERGRRGGIILQDTQKSKLTRKGSHWQPDKSGALLILPPPKTRKEQKEVKIHFGHTTKRGAIGLMNKYTKAANINTSSPTLFQLKDGKPATFKFLQAWTVNTLKACKLYHRGTIERASWRAGLATDSVRYGHNEPTTEAYKHYPQLGNNDVAHASRQLHQAGAKLSLELAISRGDELDPETRTQLQHAASTSAAAPIPAELMVHEWSSRPPSRKRARHGN
jgi:hypothetical protein